MDHPAVIEIRPPSLASRVIRFPLVRILIGALFVVAPMPAVMLFAEIFDKPMRVFWPELLAAVLCIFAYRLFVTRVEKRDVPELSGEGLATGLGGGLLIGAALVCMVFGLLAGLGVYEFTGMNEANVRMLLPFGTMAMVGTFEEILMRGIVFRIVEKSLGSVLALVVSAVLFGIGHLFNEGATVLAISNATIAGLLFATAYMSTRRLWLPIGMHVAWNFTVSQLFSASVSGHEAETGLLRGLLVGPEWLTGGTFGIEGSVVTTVVITLMTLGLFAQAKRKGYVMPMSWRRNLA